MELHLKITGCLLIVLSVIHLIFPKYFKWRTELASLSLVNRQIMYVHTFFIAFTLLLMGVFCLIHAADIIATPLGRSISLGFSIFWAVRLYFQFFVYSPRLWKGKRFELIIHILFSILWVYLTVIFFLTYRS